LFASLRFALSSPLTRKKQFFAGIRLDWLLAPDNLSGIHASARVEAFKVVGF
jgi:hypothetical protein